MRQSHSFEPAYFFYIVFLYSILASNLKPKYLIPSEGFVSLRACDYYNMEYNAVAVIINAILNFTTSTIYFNKQLYDFKKTKLYTFNIVKLLYYE